MRSMIESMGAKMSSELDDIPEFTHRPVGPPDYSWPKYEIALHTKSVAMVYLLDVPKMIELRNALNDRINGCKDESK